jgi:predicted DNA-binding transcriptional regulator AlpA
MSDLLDIPEVSKVTRVPEATLRYWRHKGTGPKSFKLGPRRVMYRREDVEAWIEEQYTGDGAV